MLKWGRRVFVNHGFLYPYAALACHKIATMLARYIVVVIAITDGHKE